MTGDINHEEKGRERNPKSLIVSLKTDTVFSVRDVVTFARSWLNNIVCENEND